jgi:hypothetical protein
MEWTLEARFDRARAELILCPAPKSARA